MKIIHAAILTIATIILASPADAGRCPCRGKSKSGNKSARKMAAKQKAERELNKKVRDMKLDAIKAYMKPKDSNGDGSLTVSEFISNESNKDAATEEFDEANTNGDRYLTKSEVADMLGLDKKAEEMIKAQKKKKK